MFLPAATSLAMRWMPERSAGPGSVSQLGNPPVHGLRHPAELVGVALALLAQAAIGEPLIETLGLKHLGSSVFVAVGEGVACSSLLLRLGAPGSRRTCVEVG